MKKLKLSMLFFLTAILVSLIWVSCAKEDEKMEVATEDLGIVAQNGGQGGSSMGNASVGTRSSCHELFSQITVAPNGMLSFTSMSHFDQVTICLEEMVEAQNDALEAANPGTTDEEIQAIIDAAAWSEDQPMIDLENSLGFFSLRKSIEGQLDTWLNNSVLDPNTNPDNHIITDEETRSLLTPDCKAIIAGQVVDFCSPGSSTVGGGGGTLAIAGICNGNCCSWGKSESTLEFDNGTKKIIVSVSLRNKLGLPAKMKAKVLSCRKENNKWKRYRTDLRITTGGSVFELNGCNDGPSPFAKQKPSNGGTKRRAKLRVAVNDWLAFRAARDNDISATGFQGSSQSNFRSVFLTF